MKYRKKPVEVEAIQFTGNNGEEIQNLFGDKVKIVRQKDDACQCYLYNGLSAVVAGDYIVSDVYDELSLYTSDIFEATYSVVSETKTGAELIADKRLEITGTYSDYLTTVDDVLKHINSGGNYINKLAIAGALIAAEIDRLQNQNGGGE